MITEEKCYSATCDVCGELFENNHEAWSMFMDRETLIPELDESGWFYGHSKDEHTGKTYCEKCHHFNDEDVLVVKEKTEPVK